MQDSISANHLHPASFKHSPLPSSKLPSNHSILKVTQFSTEGFLPFSENSKKILSRVFSQERIDSRQNERIASNLTSSSSKKRLILKNRQKFPSDFFQDSDAKINPELLEKRLTSHAESLVPAISIAHLHQDPLLNQDMLDFIDADQGNIHETPKFSCDNSPILNQEAQYIQEPRYNNLFEIVKDRAGTANVLTNSIDNIKKLEFNRIYSALLPNTRGLGNLSERVLNEGHGPAAKRDSFQAKKAHYEAGLSGILNESNSELGKPVSRVSSQESMYRPIIFYNNEFKEKDHPHNGNISNNAKIRTKRNKQLEEIIALKRRSSEILSKASQSALPKLRNYGEPSNSNISLLKAKAEGFLGLNLSHARKEDRGVKVFDYRLKPTENSTLNTRNTSEGSPLLYNDSFMTKTRQTEESDPFAHLVLTSAKKPGYEIIVHSARKPSGGSTESNGEILSHSDGEEKSGTALRRYTSVENKGGALLSAKELERKLNGRSEGGARNKAKIILHRRHASMQLDHAVLMKYEQKKGIEEKPVRHASAQKVIGKPPSYQGQVNNFVKESPGVKNRVGKVDRIQQSRSASNLRPDTMEIKSRINSKGPKKEYNSAVPEQKNNGRKEQNYSTQVQAQAQNQAPTVEQGENNQNVANKVSTRQRGFTFGKDSKEEEKNKASKSAIQEDIVIIEDRKESETSYRVETKEDFPTQDLMQKFV